MGGKQDDFQNFKLPQGMNNLHFKPISEEEKPKEKWSNSIFDVLDKKAFLELENQDLQKFLADCSNQGFGLFKCNENQDPKLTLESVQKIIKFPFRATIIRKTEINIYSLIFTNRAKNNS